MKTNNTDEIIQILKRLLIGAYYDRFTYGITFFEASVFNDPLNINAALTISDFELENKEEWNKWIATYPINISNFCGPEEPARGLLMTLLTQVKIKDIEEENNGTLILHFENELRVRLIGEDKLTDLSWSILFKDEDEEKIGRVYCSFNEMFLEASDRLMKRIKNET